MSTEKQLTSSEKRQILNRRSNELNEHNDCTVISVATVCDVTYDEAHAVLKELGRKKGQGCNRYIWLPAVEKIGLHWVEVTGAFKGKTINSLEAELPKGEKFLITIRGHLMPFNGERLIDYSKGRRFKVQAIFHIAGSRCQLMDECKRKRISYEGDLSTFVFYWFHPDKKNQCPDGEYRIYIRENGQVRWLNSKYDEWDAYEACAKAAHKRWIHNGGEQDPATITTDDKAKFI